MKKQFKTILRTLGVAFLVTVLVLQAIPISTASATQITLRSLTLQAGAADGGSKPGGVVNHLFAFTVPTGGSVGSIKFEYCTLAAGACVTPAGLVTTAATLGTETGANGFTMVNTTNGAPYLTRGAANISVNAVLTYQLMSVTNPTTVDPLLNHTFFVRITTHTAADATDAAIDSGTVNASTSTQIVINGVMPESLVFCTGATIGLNGISNLPDCATASAGAISFDQLFSPTDTASTQSQMAASTNAGLGYAISVNGPTLTSGSNTIVPMNAMVVGAHGVSQFGLNLKANTITTTTVPRGIEVAPVANATNYRGQAATNYDTVDNFKFTSGDTVANSANGTPGATDAQIFTVSYIVNVPGSQAAGTYTTTLTYICTPTF